MMLDCPYCPQMFETPEVHEDHIRAAHPGRAVHVCTVCAMSFTRRTGLAEHRRIHTGEKPYCCSDCSRNFIRLNSLKAHMQSHHREKSYICDLCYLSYTYSTSLKTHMERKHPYEHKIDRDLKRYRNDHKNEFSDQLAAELFLRNLFSTDYQICPYCNVHVPNLAEHAMLCQFRQGPSWG